MDTPVNGEPATLSKNTETTETPSAEVEEDPGEGDPVSAPVFNTQFYSGGVLLARGMLETKLYTPFIPKRPGSTKNPLNAKTWVGVAPFSPVTCNCSTGSVAGLTWEWTSTCVQRCKAPPKPLPSVYFPCATMTLPAPGSPAWALSSKSTLSVASLTSPSKPHCGFQ